VVKGHLAKADIVLTSIAVLRPVAKVSSVRMEPLAKADIVLTGIVVLRPVVSVMNVMVMLLVKVGIVLKIGVGRSDERPSRE
jgi:hypothetical protein